MDISALAGVTGQKTDASKGKNELGQEDFLKLMVTQMKNQDPFSPMENGEFMSQIAQFTSASGIGELQKSFSQFQKDMATDQSLRAAAMVGREVLVESDRGHLPEGGTLGAVIELPRNVENLTVSVYNPGGELIAEVPLGRQSAGEIDFSWDGKNSGGETMPSGTYHLAASTELAGETYSLATLMAGQVKSVTMSGAGYSPVLNLDGLGEVSLADVRQIR